MKRLTWAVWLVLVIFTQIDCAKKQPQDACGFVQNSDAQRVSWKNMTPIRIYFDASVPSQYYPVFAKAITTWEQAIGHKVFILDSNPLPASQPAQDGRSIIYWVNNWPQDQTSVMQQANTTIYYADNQLTEVDMRINATNYTFSISQPGPSDVDLESLVLHELGHAMGLKHIDDVASVMAKSLPFGLPRRTLFPIDSSDIKCEY